MSRLTLSVLPRNAEAGEGDPSAVVLSGRESLRPSNVRWLYGRARDGVSLHCSRGDVFPSHAFWKTYGLLLGRGSLWIRDTLNHERQVGSGEVARAIGSVAASLLLRPFLSRRTLRRIEVLEAMDPPPLPLSEVRALAYLRTDLWFGVRTGGSVAHTDGFLRAAAEVVPEINVWTTDHLTYLPPSIPQRLLPLPTIHSLREREWSEASWPYQLGKILRDLALWNPSVIYERYSVNSALGLALGQSLRVPFVLEYNGSETWMRRNWGGGDTLANVSERIEEAVLSRASLVVVGSRAAADEIEERGIRPRRLIVNPNAVDPSKFRPDLPVGRERERLGLNESTIIFGFVGTFGPWHGAEVLVRAFQLLLAGGLETPLPGIALLMIGDGASRKECERAAGKTDAIRFLGAVPQDRTPVLLSLCDVLVAPHVQNPDGSRFFGSPTKLFEYMATGRAVIASDLEQLGEVLTHERNALLVPPGDPGALAAAMRRLVDDRVLRERLGRAARERVMAAHTWRQHVEFTLRSLT